MTNSLQHTRLDFPLNVYAHGLYLQQGQVDYLHFGLVEEQEDAWELGALAAQRRSTDLLLSRLPDPPCRILEIGLGLGTLASLLTERGYEVTGISPDPYQINLAEKRIANRVKLQCVTFEEFNALDNNFDVILLQESAQYLKSLLLFNKSHQLLVDKGCLLIVDEVGLRRTAQDGVEGLPLLKYTLRHAERCGFKLLENMDLSKQAIPTVDYLLRVIQTHRERLLTDIELSEQELDNLLNSLRLYQKKYHDGRYGYVLLKFEKVETPRWRLGEVKLQDKQAVRALFSEVFQHDMSESRWQWKYGRGRGMAMAAWQGNDMVAHYGGTLREILYFGQPKTSVQIVDVMVAAKERGVLTRQGPYFLVGATFPEYYTGYGTSVLLGFGFPTQRAIRVAELLGLYEEVSKMIELRWTATIGRPLFWSRIRHLHPLRNNADREIIDHLWGEMQPYFKQAIIGVRDWHHFKHRYLEHPHRHYEILLVTKRFSGHPLGIVVLHRDPENNDNCRLLDIIAPLPNIPMLIRQACRIVGNWGMRTLSLWITENFVDPFLQSNGEQHHLDVRIPHCIWYEGPPITDIKGKWWLMGGDTDFM